MHKDVIANRICYDRVKVREQALHFQRLLEIKPSLDNKPPKPFKKKENLLKEQQRAISTKKERIQLDKNVQIQQENRILLKKMLSIDLKHSDLSKKNSVPSIFQVRSSSTSKSRPSLNVYNRLEELRKIGDENKIILKKIQESKPHINMSQYEKEDKSRKYLVQKMSEFANRYTRHPFFVNDGKPFNPAAKLYRTLMNSSESPRSKGYKLFSQTMYNEIKHLKPILTPLNCESKPTLNGSSKKHKVRKIKLKKSKQQIVYFNSSSGQNQEGSDSNAQTNSNTNMFPTLEDHFQKMEEQMKVENGTLIYQAANGRQGLQRPQIRTAHERGTGNLEQVRADSFDEPATTQTKSVERNIQEANGGYTDNIQSIAISINDYDKKANLQSASFIARSLPLTPFRSNTIYQ